MSAPIAGWYTDPASTDHVRWWDGSAWTQHVQAAPRPQPDAIAPRSEDELIEAVLAADARVAILPDDTESASADSASVDPGPVHTSATGNGPAADGTGTRGPSRDEDTAQTTLTPAGRDDPPPAKRPRRSLLAVIRSSPRPTITAALSIAVMAGSFAAPWLRIGDTRWSIFDSHIPWIVTGGSWDGAPGPLSHGPIYAGLICLALAGLGRRIPKGRWALLGSGLAALALTVANYLQINDAVTAAVETSSEVGLGVYLMLAGSLGLIGSTVQAAEHHGS